MPFQHLVHRNASHIKQIRKIEFLPLGGHQDLSKHSHDIFVQVAHSYSFFFFYCDHFMQYAQNLFILKQKHSIGIFLQVTKGETGVIVLQGCLTRGVGPYTCSYEISLAIGISIAFHESRTHSRTSTSS